MSDRERSFLQRRRITHRKGDITFEKQFLSEFRPIVHVMDQFIECIVVECTVAGMSLRDWVREECCRRPPNEVGSKNDL
jgi:hypothetical protein